jgi:sialic acid synthase
VTLSVASERTQQSVGSIERGPEGYDRAVRELVIDGRRIADDSPCFVIAEIGHNHQGSVEKAQELFVLAKQCGVDAVKLQKRDNRRLYTRALYDSPYDNENSFGATYGEHREALELDRGAYAELRACARELGLTLLATAFDERSADLLEELDMPAYKIASGDVRNTPLLRHVASFGKPLIVSTGGSTVEDVDRAVEVVTAVNPHLCLLQCTAAYPASIEELNLGVITTLRDRYPELVIGLSDHQDGIAMAPVAYMLGARVIEKHFTSSHTAKGTDHAFSLMPEGMRKLVRDLRRVPLAIGDGVKRPLPSEEQPLQKMGKKLVAARDLPAGHVLGDGDLVAKSPADGGLPPYMLDGLLGGTLVRALAEEEAILAGDVDSADARNGLLQAGSRTASTQ